MADYEPITKTLGNLVAICPSCDGIMNRRVNVTKIGQIQGKMVIRFPLAQQHIVKNSESTVNSDLRERSET